MKTLLTSYAFTPGGAGVGTITVPGEYALEQFLLITNVTDGVVIYQFNSPSKGAALSVASGDTTLTLEFSTATMSSGDALQIFADSTTGASANTVLSGSGAPGSGTGSDGDFYIDVAATRIYGPKASGAWGSGTSLVGASGTSDYNDLTNLPTLGTASPLDVAATGDASSSQVVKGNDSRLTDTRTPSAHNQAASTISDSTTAGRALLTAADAAAQRTSLGLGTAATTAATDYVSATTTRGANVFLAGPTSGSASAPTFRALVAGDLPATAVTPGIYGSAAAVSQLTVDAAGRITAISPISIAIAAGAVSGLASVATSGSYTDLSNRPTLGTAAATASSDYISATATRSANLILAGPSTGSAAVPAFRSLVAADLPTTTVSAGSYTYGSFTVDAAGRLTAASSGTAPVTSVTGTAPISSSGGATPAISISAASTGAAGSMSATDKTKLDGVATGATANSSDAMLLARGNHTGTQAAGTITGLGSLATQSATLPSSAIVGTTDTQTLSGKTLGNLKETTYTITDGAAFEIDPANGPIQTITLGANRTPAATNFASGQSVKLKIGDGTAYAITWTTVGVVWLGQTAGASGTAPTLGATGWTHIELWKEGSIVYGALIGYSAT